MTCRTTSTPASLGASPMKISAGSRNSVDQTIVERSSFLLDEARASVPGSFAIIRLEFSPGRSVRAIRVAPLIGSWSQLPSVPSIVHGWSSDAHAFPTRDRFVSNFARYPYDSTMAENDRGLLRWKKDRRRGSENVGRGTPHFVTPADVLALWSEGRPWLGQKQTGNSSELARIGVGSECPVYRRPFSGASTTSTRLPRPWAVVAT